MGRFEFDKYHKRIREGPCLFCSLANHDVDVTQEHYLYEDEFAIVVLDRYPTQYGYSLVFPRQHVEQIFLLDTETYLRLQAIVHKTVKAVQLATGAERVYTACLGSQLLSPHIHYHVVPIFPGLPLEDQQWNALDKSRGVLKYSEQTFSEVATKIMYAMKKIAGEDKDHF